MSMRLLSLHEEWCDEDDGGARFYTFVFTTRCMAWIKRAKAIDGAEYSSDCFMIQSSIYPDGSIGIDMPYYIDNNGCEHTLDTLNFIEENFVKRFVHKHDRQAGKYAVSM